MFLYVFVIRGRGRTRPPQYRTHWDHSPLEGTWDQTGSDIISPCNHKSGWYASYRNAFLFILKKTPYTQSLKFQHFRDKFPSSYLCHWSYYNCSVFEQIYDRRIAVLDSAVISPRRGKNAVDKKAPFSTYNDVMTFVLDFVTSPGTAGIKDAH